MSLETLKNSLIQYGAAGGQGVVIDTDFRMQAKECSTFARFIQWLCGGFNTEDIAAKINKLFQENQHIVQSWDPAERRQVLSALNILNGKFYRKQFKLESEKRVLLTGTIDLIGSSHAPSSSILVRTETGHQSLAVSRVQGPAQPQDPDVQGFLASREAAHAQPSPQVVDEPQEEARAGPFNPVRYLSEAEQQEQRRTGLLKVIKQMVADHNFLHSSTPIREIKNLNAIEENQLGYHFNESGTVDIYFGPRVLCQNLTIEDFFDKLDRFQEKLLELTTLEGEGDEQRAILSDEQIKSAWCEIF